MEKLLREAVDAIKGLKQKTQITLKRVYGWFVVHGQTTAGVDKAIWTEDDGTLGVSHYGTDGAGDLVGLLVATDGEVVVINSGRDSSGNVNPLRTNASQQLQVEVVSSAGAARTVVDAVAIPAAEADVWDPGTDNTEYFDVELEIVPIDTANDATGVSVGVDYGDTGSTDRYFVAGITATTSEVGIRIGPYRIGGDDVIRAVCDNANDAELHIFVKEEGTAT